MTTTSKRRKFDFERSISDLEQIVVALEQNQLPLDQAFSQFEQGVKLVKQCQHYLDDVEEKMDKLRQSVAPELDDEDDLA